MWEHCLATELTHRFLLRVRGERGIEKEERWGRAVGGQFKRNRVVGARSPVRDSGSREQIVIMCFAQRALARCVRATQRA